MTGQAAHPRIIRTLGGACVSLLVVGLFATSAAQGAASEAEATTSDTPTFPAAHEQRRASTVTTGQQLSAAEIVDTSTTALSTAPPAGPATSAAPTTTIVTQDPVPTTSPAPPTTAAPAPPPTAPPESAQDQVEAAYQRVVPARWRAAIEARVRVIAGSTSWADWDGTISISESHVSRGAAALEVVISHEFGHLIAFYYGSQEYNGAAPEGWPSSGSSPEERWAKCVAGVFAGRGDTSHGLPPCDGAPLSWTADWLAGDPSRHPRTA